MGRLHRTLILLACFALSAGLLACGEDDGGGTSVDESTDAETVLDRTFSGDRQIQSADLALAFTFDVKGSRSSSFRVDVEGPIDSSGDGFPVFDLEATVKGDSPARSLDLTAGATSTGDAAFVNYDGTDYEVDEQTFSLLSSAFALSGQSDSESQDPQGLPAFREFLKDVRNEGTEDVEGVEAVHVSGVVDIDGLVARIRPLAARASQLGGVAPTGRIPSPRELDQLAKLVKSASFEVWSGADDNLLRRFATRIELDQPRGAGTAEIGVDITLAEVNEPQEVEAPADAEPLAGLLDQLGLAGSGLGSLGGLGGLGGLAPGGDAGSGGSGGGGGAGEGGAAAPELDPALPPGTPGVPSPEQAEEYIQCIEQVVTSEDLERCQDLLR